MKEIKFRAWDKKTKKMRQVVEIVFNTGFMVEPNDNTVKLVYLKGYDIIEQKDIMFKRESGFELMQYTGLKDKKGKEIYEGDILRVEKVDLAYIYYDEDRMAWGIKAINEFYFDSPLLSENVSLELEVIGNIYDNPDLLEKGKEE